MANIMALNRKRGSIKNQLTKLNNVLTEGLDNMDISELQAQLDIVLSIQQKFETLRDDYYKIAEEEDFQKVEASLFEVDDDIQKLEKKVFAFLSNENMDSHWEIDLLIVPNITNFTPSKKLNVSNLNIPREVKLADPSFFIPQKIDILLGAELFFSLLNDDKIKLADNSFLQSSYFGYLVSGVISDNNFYNTSKHCFLTKNLDILNNTLKRFWEIEEIESNETCSDELKYCNEHFAKSHYRKPDGRYVVEMPFKPDFSEEMLGNSKAVASKRLDQLWTRLERDPAMQMLYSDFLSEYELLQHMEEMKENSGVETGYYLPHHGVLRPSNKTTKLRVVFNASSKTSSRHSLNDLLCKGGVLQEDLFSILIRFRKHAYVFTADRKQMFRMIEVNPSQTKLQRMWKNSNHGIGKCTLKNCADPSDGLIRVGGRLAHSNLKFNQKHPVILPAGNKIVEFIFQYYHKRDFHVGPQALLNTVRLKYRPIGGRNAARKVVHECVECFRNNPVVANQIMGDLPAERVTPSSVFLNAGIDLCGPFEIKYKGQRKGTLQKIYVALFICMATKAVHIDVSDLTSEALIATLKRFFARRGRSSMIFSDNAANFTGASAELKRLYKLMLSSEDVSNMLSSEGIRWTFLPPRAPNFGGLWEAGVKSFKYHFKRVVGSARLTLEQFLTVITQIEGILNSRPLTPLPTDTDEFQVITPAHFLIGKPINSIPEPNFIDKRDNLLNR
ncbi:uncharacterized protein [Parasteatoda tepidariorum]|uniref:uncharacterized protein n=1 Tax=Parasteatoda tepidariorum TaxID=114398 RepID=UPI0039BD6D32